MVALGSRVTLRRADILREMARQTPVMGVVKGEASGLCEGMLVVRDDSGDWHVRPAEQWEVAR